MNTLPSIERLREISENMKAQSAHLAETDNAFETAISTGRLSRDITRAEYAGNYMYMGTNSQGRALFKSIISREYIA